MNRVGHVPPHSSDDKTSHPMRQQPLPAVGGCCPHRGILRFRKILRQAQHDSRYLEGGGGYGAAARRSVTVRRCLAPLLNTSPPARAGAPARGHPPVYGDPSAPLPDKNHRELALVGEGRKTLFPRPWPPATANGFSGLRLPVSGLLSFFLSPPVFEQTRGIQSTKRHRVRNVRHPNDIPLRNPAPAGAPHHH